MLKDSVMEALEMVSETRKQPACRKSYALSVNTLKLAALHPLLENLSVNPPAFALKAMLGYMRQIFRNVYGLLLADLHFVCNVSCTKKPPTAKNEHIGTWSLELQGHPSPHQAISLNARTDLHHA